MSLVIAVIVIAACITKLVRGQKAVYRHNRKVIQAGQPLRRLPEPGEEVAA